MDAAEHDCIASFTKSISLRCVVACACMKVRQWVPVHVPAAHLPVVTDSMKVCMTMLHMLFVPLPMQLTQERAWHADCAGCSAAPDACQGASPASKA